ncbi:MAG: hypothetical protein H7330_11385 [Hymenobacteraceae bacterium]|nr:hypothetical protein [Hymenobacteraceae bacterium]
MSVLSAFVAPARWAVRGYRRLKKSGLLLAAALLAAPLASWAQAGTDRLPADPGREWLIYVALGLGGLNLILLYLLNRSPRRASDSSDLGGTESDHSSSSRTEKRMEKRKREIDDLRLQVDTLSEQLASDSQRRLTTPQIQDLVRALVHDELTRAALPGSAGPPKPPAR